MTLPAKESNVTTKFRTTLITFSTAPIESSSAYESKNFQRESSLADSQSIDQYGVHRQTATERARRGKIIPRRGGARR